MGVLFLFFGVLCFFCFNLPFVHILKNKSTFCFTCKNSMKRGCSDVYHAFVAVNILGLFLCGCAEFLSSAGGLQYISYHQSTFFIVLSLLFMALLLHLQL